MASPIVIAGMHRSGTSLLANLLDRAGVDLGDRMLAANDSNALGHFEDLDFKDLHDAALIAHRYAALYVTPADEEVPIAGRHLERARTIIRERRSRVRWGWKDPRTTLFLDFWATELPDARFCFIFRRPEEVVDSLRRRGTDRPLHHRRLTGPILTLFGMPRFRMRRAIAMWQSYNRRVLRFLRERPERSLLIDLAALDRHYPMLVDHVRDDWGIPLDGIDVNEVVEPRLLGTSAPDDIREACERTPGVRETYEALVAACSFEPPSDGSSRSR